MMLGRFYGQAGFVFAGSAVARAKDLIVTPLLTFYAGSALYGAWTQANLVVAFATPLVGLGLQQGFVRYASGLPEREQAGRFVGLFVISFSVGAALLAAVWIFPGALESLLFAGEEGFTAILLAVSLMLMVNPMRGAYESWYVMRGRARALVGIRFGNSLATIGVLAWLVSDDAGFTAVVYGVVAVECLFLLVFVLLTLREFGPTMPDLAWARSGIAFGAPLLPGGMSMFSVHFIDRLIIPRYGTVADVGIYAFAYSVALIAVNFATTPLKTVYGNTAYGFYNEGRHDELRQMCRHALASTVAVALPASVALYFLGPALAQLMAPEEFNGAGGLMWIVALGYLAQSVSKVFRVNMTFTRGSGRVLGLLLFTSFFNLVLNLLLIPRYGLYGAAWATTVALCAAAAIAAVFAHGDFRVALDAEPFAWIGLGTVIMGGVMAGTRILLVDAGIPILLTGAVIGVLGFLAYAGVVARPARRYLCGGFGT